MPDKIGHYTIVSELGRGGMGVVYKAHEESLNRFVAIKVLGEHLSSDEQFLSRFVREARAAAGLSHPNIVQIYVIGEDQGKHYFVMEYVSGRSVQQMIAGEGRIGNPRAAQIILQAAQGLAAAHDQGIIHRDIKPGNLMVDERGVVKIADFGLALPMEAHTRLTVTGALMGTPGYLSPEHCFGEPVDHRADIYALGVSYFEMLTGVVPFRAESPLALLRQITQEQPPDVSELNPEVDADARRILMKMIAKDRNDRYQDCHALIADLEEYVAGRGVRSLTAGLAARGTGARAASSAAEQATAKLDATPAVSASQAVTAVQSASTPAKGATAIKVPAAAAPVTEPSPGFIAPATIPPTPAPQRRSSPALMIAAVLLLVLLGGGAAAFVLSKLPITRSIFGGKPAGASPGVGGPPVKETKAAMTNTALRDELELSAPKQIPIPTLEQRAPSSTTERRQATSGKQQQPAEARTRSTEPQRVEEQPPPRSSRRLSGVAIAVAGDQVLNNPVSEAVRSEMSAAGLEVADARELPAIEGMVSQGDLSPTALINRLREAGLAVLVVARIEPTGTRTLNYMDRQDTAYASRITLSAYDVATGRPIGQRATANLEYTHLNADREAEKAVGRWAQKIAESLPK